MKARHRLRCKGLGRKRAQEDSGVAETRGLTGGSSRPRCDREEGDQGLTRAVLASSPLSHLTLGRWQVQAALLSLIQAAGTRAPQVTPRDSVDCCSLCQGPKPQAGQPTAAPGPPSTPEALSRKATKGPEGAPGPAGRPTSLPSVAGTRRLCLPKPLAAQGDPRVSILTKLFHSSAGVGPQSFPRTQHRGGAQNSPYLCYTEQTLQLQVSDDDKLHGGNKR